LCAVDTTRDGWIDAAVDALVQSDVWVNFRVDAAEFRRRVHAASPRDLGDVLRQFYGAYAARHAKPRWGDKLPQNLLRMSTLAAMLPEARFVHIVRDGRDVALSWRLTPFRPADAADALVERWAERIREGRRQAQGVPYLEIHYEALIAEPARTLADVCTFLELPYDDAMLRYHDHANERLAEEIHAQGRGRIPGDETLSRRARHLTQRPFDASIGRWRRELSVAEQAACAGAAGGLLAQLGYPPA
jgi:hypothetical protein